MIFTCSSFSTSPNGNLSKALGYGTRADRYLWQSTRGIYVDIANEKGALVAQTAAFQFSPICGSDSNGLIHGTRPQAVVDPHHPTI